MERLACAATSRIVAIVAHPFTVATLWAVSVASLAWCCVSPSELAFTLFLSILALAMTASLQLTANQAKIIADKRDTALHAKIDGLIAGTDADDALAGIERS